MPASRDFMKRLEALNRGPLQEAAPPPAEKADPFAPEMEGLRKKLRSKSGRAGSTHSAASSPEPIVYRRDLPRPGRNGSVRSGASDPFASRPAGEIRDAIGDVIDDEAGRLAERIALEEAVSGVEVIHPTGGKAYLVVHRAADLGPEGVDLCRRFHEGFHQASFGAYPLMAGLCGGEAVRPDDLLFVDLETTGLGSASIFLVGLMTWEGDSLTTYQYFARDYSEEPSITAHFADVSRAKRLFVTFNGKSFDLPSLRARAAANGIRLDADRPHLDLLHESRRAWGKRLRNCRLQTLELSVCLRRRTDDIPGAEVPEAYHDYVRTGDASRMVKVLKHNRMDLLTLGELLIKLPAPAAK